jgi:hypothetical protein
MGFYKEVCGKRWRFPKKEVYDKLRVLHHAKLRITTKNPIYALKGTWDRKILFHIKEGVPIT